MKKRTALIILGSLIASMPFSAAVCTALSEYHAPKWVVTFVVSVIVLKVIAIFFGSMHVSTSWSEFQ